MPHAITGERAEAIDNFPTDGVVATDENLGVIVLTGNEPLWIDKLTACALRTLTIAMGSISTAMRHGT